MSPPPNDTVISAAKTRRYFHKTRTVFSHEDFVENSNIDIGEEKSVPNILYKVAIKKENKIYTFCQTILFRILVAHIGYAHSHFQ